MDTDYDVIIVGAGPAGLMAAKTMAGHQLKVALIERRNDISRWTRADCMMFYGLEGGFLGENMRVDVAFPGRGRKTDVSRNAHLAGTRIPGRFSPLIKPVISKCRLCTIR